MSAKKVDEQVGWEMDNCNEENLNHVQYKDNRNEENLNYVQNKQNVQECCVTGDGVLHSQKTICTGVVNHGYININSSMTRYSMHAGTPQGLELALLLLHDGRLNSVGLRIPLHTNWNLQLFSSLCTSDSDRELLAFLTYGWPLNRLPGPVAQTWDNHALAKKFPQDINRYLQKELKRNTILGPFVTSPFPSEVTGISPMSTQPKKESAERHIIVDLSWLRHDATSVNALIPKDRFLENPMNMTYPTIDLLCKQAYQLGPGKFAWRKDMSRAFKQVPFDPIFWCYLGMYWAGALFFDKTAVMGCCSAPYACQHTTNVIRHFMLNMSYVVYNYIDDFMSIDHFKKAW